MTSRQETREKIPSLPHSKGLADVLKLGIEDARILNFGYLHSEIFFLGLMKDKDVLKALSQSKIDPARINITIEIVEEFIGFIVPANKNAPKRTINTSLHLNKILELANAEANQANAKEVNPIHALIGAILEKERSTILHIGSTLSQMEITEEDIPDLREQAKELDLRSAGLL